MHWSARRGRRSRYQRTDGSDRQGGFDHPGEPHLEQQQCQRRHLERGAAKQQRRLDLDDPGERLGDGDDLHGFDGIGGHDLFLPRLRIERLG